MVDYVTLRTRNTETAETIKQVLDLERKVFEKTSEIQRYGNKEISKHHNMNFTVFDSGLVEITGSLHSLYNALHGITNTYGEPMNHDDFTYTKLFKTIEHMKEMFNLKPYETQVHHIEFGVNLTGLPFSTPEALDSLIVYKNKPFSPMRINGMGKGNECHLKQIGMKIYDKAQQYQLKEPTLRLEVKVRKMQALQMNRAFYLSDLLSENTWNLFTCKVLSELKMCIISDEINEADLSKKELEIFKECDNPRNWKRFEKSKRGRLKKKYNELIDKFGNLKIMSTLEIAIIRKIAILKPDQYLLK